MKRIFFGTGLVLLIGLLMFSCEKKGDDEALKEKEKKLLMQYLADNDITQSPTESGMYFIPLSEGSGGSPGPGSWVDIQFTGRLIDGTVFETNIAEIAKANGLYDQNFVYGMTRLFAENITMEGLKEGIHYMNVGERARLIIPSDLALGSGSQGLIPPYSTLIFDVALIDEFKDPELHEVEELIEYFGDPLALGDSTPEGNYYFEEEVGWGDTVYNGDDIEIWYTGTFLDGRVFESNLGQELPLLIHYPDQDDLIPGLMESLKYMRAGCQGKLVVPYRNGYGKLGARNSLGQVIVPPYMTLVLDIEVYTVQ